MSFGKTLQKVRRSKGMTQRDVAASISMDHGYFSRLENDRFDYKPSRETVEKIAEALKCTEEERTELLTEANRIDQELEKMVIDARNRPEIKKLFRAAANLSREQIEKMISQAEEEAAAKREDR